MFPSFLLRLLMITAVTGSYAVAAELPDINGATLTPPVEQFSTMPGALVTEHALAAPQASTAPSSVANVATSDAEPQASTAPASDANAAAADAEPQAPTAPASDADAAAAQAAPAESEEVRQNKVISAALQAIRQHQLTPLSTDCLSMSFVDNSDDPESDLIEVRENRNNPACGGDPETAPHLFFLKANKANGTLQTDAGVEPDDFYPLENPEQPAVAALTAEDFSVQVNGVTLTLGQVWNEDIMMSLPPEQLPSQAASPDAVASDAETPDAQAAYRYFQHRYEALTLVASNENWQQKQRSPDDNYLSEITLVNPTLATQRGVHVGMTIDEVERKYGPGEADERNGESWLNWQLDDNLLTARISNGLVTLIQLSNLQTDRDALQ